MNHYKSTLQPSDCCKGHRMPPLKLSQSPQINTPTCMQQLYLDGLALHWCTNDSGYTVPPT